MKQVSIPSIVLASLFLASTQQTKPVLVETIGLITAKPFLSAVIPCTVIGAAVYGVKRLAHNKRLDLLANKMSLLSKKMETHHTTDQAQFKAIRGQLSHLHETLNRQTDQINNIHHALDIEIQNAQTRDLAATRQRKEQYQLLSDKIDTLLSIQSQEEPPTLLDSSSKNSRDLINSIITKGFWNTTP